MSFIVFLAIRMHILIFSFFTFPSKVVCLHAVEKFWETRIIGREEEQFEKNAEDIYLNVSLGRSRF
jgi:hypothetical protein